MPRIEHLFAFIAQDSGPDDEGLPAHFDPATGAWIPLVGADINRLHSIVSLARNVAELSGAPLKLVEFTVRRELTDFVAADQFKTVEETVSRLQREALDEARARFAPDYELEREAQASVALDRGEVGTHYVGDGCPGGHR